MRGQGQSAFAKGLDHIGLFGDEAGGDLTTIGQPVGARHTQPGEESSHRPIKGVRHESGRQLDQHTWAVAHRQWVALRVQIRAALKLARGLLGVQGLTQGVYRFVEIRRCEVGAKGVHRAHRKTMRLAVGNELAHRAVCRTGLPTVFLEGDATVGEAGAHILSQPGPFLETGVGLHHIGVAGQRFEERRRTQTTHTGHEFALEGFLHFTQNLDALVADVSFGIRQPQRHCGGIDLELVVEVVDGRTIGIQDLTLQRTHAQVFQRDRMLVAHGFQVTGQHTGDGFQLGLGAEGADALDFLGQHHVVVRNVRNDEGAHLALATGADRTGRAGRHGGQQVQDTVAFFDDDLAKAGRLGREQVQVFQAAVAVGHEIDGGGEVGHVEGRIVEDVLHVWLQKRKNPRKPVGQAGSGG